MGLLMVARHLLSILLLPFMVVVVIPRWLLRGWAMSDGRWQAGAIAAAGHVAGALIFAAGFAFFAWCVWLFARVGKGTLAPWDPTQRLIAVGPYRYVRNPMITGVLTMLIGESLLFGSPVLAFWTATFFLINVLYFFILEEPGLERRFGDEYRRYKSAVPRWIPRRTPWENV
ncbi:MAG TPA: isoprenylcysteine carboxylmethyltransferase family protein [Gemmatimonadaceae bacterium]|jgi:protein-S-isoprenylcysteine O-methyltransferase Ste14|nr:isoprenylcysteine carboxylmethyltransferase family protein [Gemmatimonadaceae bacterium]